MGKTKKRVKPEPGPRVGLRVTQEQHREVTREGDPADRWSGKDTVSSWGEPKLSLSSEYPDIVAMFEVKPGDTLWLVHVHYSTGDSFNHHENGGVSYVDVFRDPQKAVACAKVIRDHNQWYRRLNGHETLTREERKLLRKRYSYEFTVDYVTETGELASASVSWNGYFEHLTAIEVTPVVVRPESF